MILPLCRESSAGGMSVSEHNLRALFIFKQLEERALARLPPLYYLASLLRSSSHALLSVSPSLSFVLLQVNPLLAS